MIFSRLKGYLENHLLSTLNGDKLIDCQLKVAAGFRPFMSLEQFATRSTKQKDVETVKMGIMYNIIQSRCIVKVSSFLTFYLSIA